MRVVIKELESSPPARLIKEILLARINIGLLILPKECKKPNSVQYNKGIDQSAARNQCGTDDRIYY